MSAVSVLHNMDDKAFSLGFLEMKGDLKMRIGSLCLFFSTESQFFGFLPLVFAKNVLLGPDKRDQARQKRA